MLRIFSGAELLAARLVECYIHWSTSLSLPPWTATATFKNVVPSALWQNSLVSTDRQYWGYLPCSNIFSSCCVPVATTCPSLFSYRPLHTTALLLPWIPSACICVCVTKKFCVGVFFNFYFKRFKSCTDNLVIDKLFAMMQVVIFKLIN